MAEHLDQVAAHSGCGHALEPHSHRRIPRPVEQVATDAVRPQAGPLVLTVANPAGR